MGNARQSQRFGEIKTSERFLLGFSVFLFDFHLFFIHKFSTWTVYVVDIRFITKNYYAQVLCAIDSLAC